ncbi:DUF4282 domain-containing protein [Mastigocoleus testarum]|uniref:DUF4282 domain-containing protein n=1 Tax=Mastigocoleus testarum BC008 TaxID=371196 RepID=A0A0V7ZRV1_9CYAN|nr:DUF4282 domain-containing protein [Mastigocoleus testarum]KST66831.1 hypothetical protein BC008_26945 [Mastigocoleus testarum BC008]KST70168.1 hypothetical protein BC008_36550 [Mastigocoleus testarum BC008]
MSLSKNFFLRLFDFSFSKFMAVEAVEIVGIFYVIGMVFAALMAVVIITEGFNNGLTLGIGSLVVAPLVFSSYIILLRIGLEEILITLGINEKTKQLENP